MTAPALPERIARQLPEGVRRDRILVDGVGLHVMCWGDPTARPVLMLHGNPTWGFLYRRVVQALLGDDLHLVVPDLPGLGLSDTIPYADHSLPRHAARIGGLVDALDLRDLVFVGQDWGGPIGLHALADRPGRTAGLVLLNTVFAPPRPGFRPTLFHRFGHWPVVSDLAYRVGGFPQNALHQVQGDRASIRGEVAWAYRWPLRAWSRRSAPLALTRMVPDRLDHPTVAPLRHVQAFVEGFDGPIRAVWGERDPILGRVVGFLERTRPDARVWRTDAGHFLQEEVPDPIAEAVRDTVQAASR